MELNLIKSIAWSFAKKTGIEFDDLFQEACIIWLEEESRFDPSKGCKKTTYMHAVLKQQLTNVLISGKYQAGNSVENETLNELTPEYYLSMKDMITSLPREAKMLCQMIFESPHEFLISNKPKHCRGQAAKQLRKRGWSWPGSIGTWNPRR